MTKLVVLTCASGKQCSNLIPLLYPQSDRFKLRLVVRSASSVTLLQKRWPDAEVVRANLAEPGDCARILEGSSVLFYVGPPNHPFETRYGFNVIDAAQNEFKKSGSEFSHFVFSSVLHTQADKLLNHQRKRHIEEYLIESNLPWTILKPSHYMDNTMARLVALKDAATPVFAATQNPDVAFSFSCVRDVGEAAARVIEQRDMHLYASYEVVSTMPMKYIEYINAVGNTIGKDIKVEVIPFEKTVDLYCQWIFNESQATIEMKDSVSQMLLYYANRGLVANPRTTEWLLGRPPTSPAELAQLYLEQQKK